MAEPRTALCNSVLLFTALGGLLVLPSDVPMTDRRSSSRTALTLILTVLLIPPQRHGQTSESHCQPAAAAQLALRLSLLHRVPSVADDNSLCALRTVLYWQGKQQHWAVESIEEQRKTTTGGSTVLVRWIGYAAATWEPLCELEHTDAYELFLRESSATSAMIMREDELPDDPFADCADTPLFVPFVPFVPRKARCPEYEPRSRRKGIFRPPSQHDLSVFDFTDDD